MSWVRYWWRCRKWRREVRRRRPVCYSCQARYPTDVPAMGQLPDGRWQCLDCLDGSRAHRVAR